MLDGESVVWLGCAYKVVILNLGSFGECLAESEPIDGLSSECTYVEGFIILIAERTNVSAGLLRRLLDLEDSILAKVPFWVKSNAYFHAMFIGPGTEDGFPSL